MSQQARDYSKGIFLPAYDYAGGIKFGYITVRMADHADGTPQVILPSGSYPWKQGFYGVCTSQGFVGGTGTAAGEPLALKRLGAGIVILAANCAVTRGDKLIASATSLGCVEARTAFSGNCTIIGTAEESLSSSTAEQRLEAYIQPYDIEDEHQIIVSQPTAATAVGAVTRYGQAQLTAFNAAQVPLYVVLRTGDQVLNLAVACAVAPAGADTLIATVQKSSDGGATYTDTALTCTITGTATAAVDKTHAVSLTVGDIVALKFVSSAATCAGVSANFAIN